MKITKFLGLSFFLFAFIATSFPEAVHAKDAEAVLDIFDVAVLADARYLIITPSAENTTHAVTASGIFVELSTLNESLPVTFSATESNDSVIRVGNYLTVSFDTASSTPMWMIASSPTAEGYVVTTGGVDRLNQFMITKSEDHDRFYQLSFCPKGEPFCECPNSVPVGVHDPEAVIDVFGNEVTAGARYFIRTTSDEDNTTTLAVSATSRIICNSDVTLSPMSDRLPITFSPAEESDDSVIREGTYLNLNFNASSCRMAGVTTMWKIELRPSMRGFVVTTGGVDRLNLFKITKYGGDNSLYQLSYCPVSDPFECSCVPVGNVVNRLVPNAKNPLPVVFEPDTDKAS
ncbi:kunitz trypsin inhibitor TI [Salix suchowensis]|nr:kunitz trypsin inhibitor TI [Salix suchowensis]